MHAKTSMVKADWVVFKEDDAIFLPLLLECFDR